MSSASSNYGRVFDGSSFQEVTHTIASKNEGGAYNPIPPIGKKFDKSTSIFVSIPHFRDGKRCAQTVRRLFDTAAHPDRVFVGLIEQTHSSGGGDSDGSSTNHDPTCLMEYCALMGHRMKHHPPGINHLAERQADHGAVLASCPRASNQIRSVRFHHYGSKGPVYARSFTRQVLGNEEFCMEIDASMDFADNWDIAAIEQWELTNNEYAVLSNVPLSAKEKASFNPVEVPRQCEIKIGSEGVPLFETHADGKAIGLTQPLLSRTYSPSFVFSKCHYQTNVPQDPFAVQLLNTEQFPHFARMWTRGFDVYTPAVNLVYKDNSDLHPLHHVAGHGEQGEKKWPRNDSERRDAHVRMKVMLNIHHGITNSEIASMTAGGSGSAATGGGGGRMITARGNLGIYGLGRRRTLDQLLQFASIALPDSEFRGQYGNEGKGCANLKWVPYDKSISPRANLLDGTGKADDLELEPEFPLRTRSDSGDYLFPAGSGVGRSDATSWKDPAGMSHGGNVPYSFVFLLWVLGLYVWYASFVDTATDGKGRSSRTGRRVSPRKSVRKVAPLSERALQNI